MNPRSPDVAAQRRNPGWPHTGSPDAAAQRRNPGGQHGGPDAAVLRRNPGGATVPNSTRIPPQNGSIRATRPCRNRPGFRRKRLHPGYAVINFWGFGDE